VVLNLRRELLQLKGDIGLASDRQGQLVDRDRHPPDQRSGYRSGIADREQATVAPLVRGSRLQSRC
jgi:hypothetical protein